MADLHPTKTGETRSRVEDYLDDKIQTTADLDQVEFLLQQVQEQQSLLRKQVRTHCNSLQPLLTFLFSLKMQKTTSSTRRNESTSDPVSCKQRRRPTEQIMLPCKTSFKRWQIHT
jgi:hypothetical protein